MTTTSALILRRRRLDLFAQLDALAEQGIRDGLDLAALKPGELCPLRQIVDIAARAKAALPSAFPAAS